MTKKERLIQELERAKERRTALTKHIQELEKKIREEEKKEIHKAIDLAGLTTEETERLIKRIKAGK